MLRRHTIQKEMVLDAVRTIAGHATAEEVFEYIHQSHPSIGRGTVYRNLHILTEEGEIRAVEVPDGPIRFDHNCAEHYHVRCIDCGWVYDVEMDAEDMLSRIHDSRGIRFLSFDILFKGICPLCLKKRGEE